MSNLIVIDGFLGAGKTLGMSYLAHHYQSKSNCTLYSNYGLANAKPIKNLVDFIDVAKQESSIVCLDESHLDLSSRDFNSNSVKFFTNLIFYLRKMRCTLIMTTPMFSNLDSRVRDITNVYISVRKDKNFFYYDFYDVEREQFLKRKRIRYDLITQIGSHLYDTYSIVTPLEYPSKKEEFNEFLKELKQVNGAFKLR
ncbi:hypothetical protein PDK24_28165 [Bacillus cereus]|uniref:hypothetical protein n=1 Tax=Bacillus cereus group TaxID=86661 RepID=UPI0010BEF2B8|nr:MULTISPECIES: hypothetical protein [Bacillus cereus group]MBX0351816.1 hypothetical protein [Bacillus toyonensis]MDA1909645.1 hypothetical protein [Bacillus cereus]MDA2191601.1 hypothetical protein [Bacillus cereus]MDA2208567.1 hypothetical protein [Bacillus cereus]MDA2716773.1 hypothetical protein [Bacillus cereus group sp. Bc025]